MRELDLHPESLLRLSLLATALADERVAWTPRAFDRNWLYQRFPIMGATGFRPFDGRVFYAAQSATADWLARPEGPTRSLNPRDRLVKEVLFLVHDYLHAWSAGLIRALRPELGFGSAPLTQENFEAQVFAHLVTEAVATVGLDNWYLSTIQINDFCPIGTRIMDLAVGYREDQLAEYQRSQPGLRVQEPSFFVTMAEVYCTGVWEGLDIADLDHSPALDHWVSKELLYGEKQREYTRAWLEYLSGQPLAGDSLGRPVACDQPWQRELMTEVGHALWRLIKEQSRCDEIDVAPTASTWRRPGGPPRTLDVRFTNVHACTEPELEHFESRDLSADDFSMLASQYLCQFDYEQFPVAKLPFIHAIVKARDFKALRDLCRGEAQVASDTLPERDLFFIP